MPSYQRGGSARGGGGGHRGGGHQNHPQEPRNHSNGIF